MLNVARYLVAATFCSTWNSLFFLANNNFFKKADNLYTKMMQ